MQLQRACLTVFEENKTKNNTRKPHVVLFSPEPFYANSRSALYGSRKIEGTVSAEPKLIIIESSKRQIQAKIANLTDVHA